MDLQVTCMINSATQSASSAHSRFTATLELANCPLSEMDEAGQIAIEDFRESTTFSSSARGDPEDFAHQTAIVTTRPGGALDLRQSTRTTKQLPQFFGSGTRHGSDGDEAARRAALLRIVGMDMTLEGRVLMDAEVFIELSASIGIDSSVLWLLSQQYDGYHQFPCEDGRSTTFFLGTSTCAILWIHHHQRATDTTITTDAFFIERAKSARNSSAHFHDFVDLLGRHSAYIASPTLMPYLAGLMVSRQYDQEIADRELSYIREVERQTGFALNSAPTGRRHGVDQISTWLQGIGEKLMHFANKERHLRMICSVLSGLEAGRDGEEMERSTEKLLQAVPRLVSRIEASLAFIKYLKERSERLSAVLFALLTHEDSLINIDLADSSRRIAEEAKRDSTSMKTIAVMTMAFLPATFMATLFAVPSLDWQSDPVVQPNFWVYWAFSLPATVLAFFLWFVLTKERPAFGTRQKRQETLSASKA